MGWGEKKFKCCVAVDMPKKRKRPCDETLDEIWIALRKVQRKTGCTTKVLKLTLDAITPFLKNGKKVLKNGKKKLRTPFEKR